MGRPRKKAAEPPRYLVLRDSGEKEGHGWVFAESEHCRGTRRANLYTGDYSLEGYYDDKLFVIERKGAVEEFAGNLTSKEKWDDFRQELERLEEFRWPFVVCEFPYSLLTTYPVGSGVPRHLWGKIKVSPRFLVKRFWEIQLRFKTRFVFTSGPGKDAAASLFKRVLELCPCPSPAATNDKPGS